MMWFCHMKLCCGKKVRTAFKYLLQQFYSSDRGNSCVFVILLQSVTPDPSSSWDPWRTGSTTIWSQNSQRSLDLVFHVSSSSRWLLPDGSKAVFVGHVCVCSSDKLILHVWIHPCLLFWLTVKSNEAANSCEQPGEWPRWVIPPFFSSTIPSILFFSILACFLCRKCFFYN